MVDVQDIAPPLLAEQYEHRKRDTKERHRRALHEDKERMTEHDEEKGIERELRLSKEEEEFFIETELMMSKAPCFDGLTLRNIGLTHEELEVLQAFFLKARAVRFSPWRFVKSKCVRALILCLEFLPSSERLTGNPEKDGRSSEAREIFRQTYSRALKLSRTEKVTPLLLGVLGKVFSWFEAEYPRNKTETGRARKVVEKTEGRQITRRQQKLLAKLLTRQGVAAEDIQTLNRDDASRRISALLQTKSRQAMQGAWAVR